MTPLIAYHRVSTSQQGRSGLGLEAQRAAVRAFAKAEGYEITAEFTEVETGKGSDALARRPELKAALKAAKKAKKEKKKSQSQDHTLRPRRRRQPKATPSAIVDSPPEPAADPLPPVPPSSTAVDIAEPEEFIITESGEILVKPLHWTKKGDFTGRKSAGRNARCRYAKKKTKWDAAAEAHNVSSSISPPA